MKLSEPQEATIARYLRDVALGCDGEIAPERCEQAVARLDGLIRRQLKALRKDPVDQGDVQAVLRRLGTPAEQAEVIAGRGPAFEHGPEGDAVWLGVCAALAQRFEVAPRAMRILFLLGAISGPIVVMLYLLAYGELVYVSRLLRPEPVDKGRLILRTGGIFAALIVLDKLASYALDFVNYVVINVAHRDMPPLGDWGWLQYEHSGLFSLTLLSAVPLAILSGMPLRGGWDHTLKRVSQAILAAYGIALSFGIACKIVGVLLGMVKEFTIKG